MFKAILKRIEIATKELEQQNKILEDTFDERMDIWKKEQDRKLNQKIHEHNKRPRLTEEQLAEVEAWKKSHGL